MDGLQVDLDSDVNLVKPYIQNMILKETTISGMYGTFSSKLKKCYRKTSLFLKSSI